MNLDLSQVKTIIEDKTILMFNALINVGTGVRPPERPRTGIQCCIKEPHSRNIIMPKAYEPSKVALHLASEKIVRAYEHGYYSSRVNADPKKFEFAGGLIYKKKVGNEWVEIHSGTSGMTEDEDEMISLVNLSLALKTPLDKIIEFIYPPEDIPLCIKNTQGYIWRTLIRFSYGY